MAKRFCDTEIWQKEWFQDLSLKHKVLVKYIFENCDNAGVWEVNYRLASFLIGEEITKQDIDSINIEHFLFDFISDKKIFIPKFIKFQYGKLSKKCAPHIPVIKKLEEYGLEVEYLDESNLTLKQQRKRLTQKLKEEIFARDKYECQYCGSRDDLEIDHIQPLIQGGTNNEENLITACHKCNQLKRDLDINTFLEKYKNSINVERVSKILERVNKKLFTLEEKEQEQEKEKDKEQEKESSTLSENFYGEYFNVYLDKEDYNKALAVCLDKKTLDDLIEEVGKAIEIGKYNVFDETRPHAHLALIKAFHKQKRLNPNKFQNASPESLESRIDKLVALNRKRLETERQNE